VILAQDKYSFLLYFGNQAQVALFLGNPMQITHNCSAIFAYDTKNTAICPVLEDTVVKNMMESFTLYY
jgi:hypothetical protein